jgi:hypothetical protein
MALDTVVKINLSKPAGNVGSWFPLIYVTDDTIADDVYAEYKGLDELIAGGYKESDEVYKVAEKMLMQEESGRPYKFAVLKQKAFAKETFAKYEAYGWRQLLLTDTENVAAVSAHIEETDKMLFITVSDKDALTYKCDRTFAVYHPTDAYAAAAVVGVTAGYEAGSFTYKNVVLKGVEPVELSEADIKAIHNAGGVTILLKAGDIVTSEGIVTSGEYADIIDSQDYIVQNIAYRTQKVFNDNKKVAYTDAGIGLLEGATISVLKTAFNNDMIATDANGVAAYTVNFALRSETTELDRAARVYPYGKFTFELAGAIHTATVSGEIIV